MKYTVSVVPAGGTVVRTISAVRVSADGVLELRFRDLGGQNSNFVVSGLEISSGALPAQAPLLAEGDPLDDGAATVSPSQLNPVVAEANARWAATGLTADQTAALSQTQFVVADLGAATLGLADTAMNVVQIDDDAAGLGWSVIGDHLPITDYRSPITGIDLLTVVTHEMGHLLGYGHSEDAEDLMAPALWAGPGRAFSPVPNLGSLTPHPSSFIPHPSSPCDDLFADLGRDRTEEDDDADRTSPLLAVQEAEVFTAARIRPSEEATQARVPRRGRVPRYEREVDAWFDGLAREVDEAADLPTGGQS